MAIEFVRRTITLPKELADFGDDRAEATADGNFSLYVRDLIRDNRQDLLGKPAEDEDPAKRRLLARRKPTRKAA